MNGTPLSAQADASADGTALATVGFALLATGEPVELIHLEEDADGRRALVETVHGRRLRVEPEGLIALPPSPAARGAAAHAPS